MIVATIKAPLDRWLAGRSVELDADRQDLLLDPLLVLLDKFGMLGRETDDDPVAQLHPHLAA